MFQGLLVATPIVFKDPEKFVFLWLHESERVYGDRLVDYDDLNKFKMIMQSQARKGTRCRSDLTLAVLLY